jgi:redox-sensing transcriptional repressor
MDAAKLVPTIRKRKVKIAVVTVPAEEAQPAADLLVEAGVTAILNFAPTQLAVPEGVKVQNVDLSVLLKTLSYHTVRTGRTNSRRLEASTTV